MGCLQRYPYRTVSFDVHVLTMEEWALQKLTRGTSGMTYSKFPAQKDLLVQQNGKSQNGKSHTITDFHSTSQAFVEPIITVRSERSRRIGKQKRIYITMKFSTSVTTAVLAGAALAQAFSVQSSIRTTSFSTSRRMAAADDFDSILGEGSSYEEAANVLQNAASSSSSSVIRVPDGSPAATVTLASSVTANDLYGDDLDLGLEDEGFEGSMMAEEEAAADPLLNNEILKRQHEKKLKKEQRKAAGGMMRYVKNPLLLVKGKDFSDVTLTILIPTFVVCLGVKKVSEIGFGKLGEKADKLYEQAATDIAYHVGDYESIENTYKDYKKKLWFNGAPSYINSEILKRLAAVFCTNVSVTPKSVSSLAYILSLMKISDDEAADSFVEACKENPNSMSIAAKVLFYSEVVFKEKSAKKKMTPLLKQLTRMFGDVEAVMHQQK